MRILLLLFFLSSCAAYIDENSPTSFGSSMTPNDQLDGEAVSQEEVIDFEIEDEEPPIEIEEKFITTSFRELLPASVGYKFTRADLKDYTKKIDDLLENSANQTSVSFDFDNHNLKVKLTVENSFEIVDLGLFCRQFTQTIDYQLTELSHNGIACRGENSWYPLRKK